MTARIEAFIERLQTTTSPESLQQLVEFLRELYAVEHVVYHIVGDSGKEYGAFTYDPGWVSYYTSEKLFRIDPVVTESLKRFHPLDWKRLDWSSPGARKLLLEAVDGRVGKQGYSVPIRGVNGQFALFSVTSFDSDDDWDRFIAEHGRDMLLIAHYLHDRVTMILGTASDAQTRVLSPRERDVLSMLATGRSRLEAAASLKISEHTFRVYVDTARHKLGALNTTHAVAMATARGLIMP